MKFIITLVFMVIITISNNLFAQEISQTNNSSSDSLQLITKSKIPDNLILLKFLNIQSQMIDNMMQMIGILYVEHNMSITKIDSILKSLNIEIRTPPIFLNEKLTTHELLNADTYFSLEKAKRTPLKVFKLDLSKNALTNVPNEIKQFKNLQKLILSDNLLIEIPDWISQLESLQYIYLSNNQFHEFPMSLTEIKSLILIDLSCNPIRYVTSDIKKCSNLEVLNLHDTILNYKQLSRLKIIINDVKIL